MNIGSVIFWSIVLGVAIYHIEKIIWVLTGINDNLREIKKTIKEENLEVRRFLGDSLYDIYKKIGKN